MPVTAKDRVLIVGFEYPLPLRRAVWPWLNRLGLLGPVDLDSPDPRPANVRGSRKTPYIVARNQAVRDIILPRADDYDWVLMLNNDVTPTESSAKFLELEGDLLSCDCPLKNPAAWAGKQAFHLALSCVRTQVFRVMEPPWFRFSYSDDYCELLGCDCEYFATKAKRLGFTIAHGGVCSHDHLGDKLCFPEG
jgi:hypothetical protein